MTPLERDAGELLERARRGLSPTPARAERVRQSLRAALAAGAAAGTGSASASARAAGDAPGVGALAGRWAGKLLVAGAIAASSGAVGYVAGRRVESRQVMPAAPAPAVEAPALAGLTPPPGAPPAAPSAAVEPASAPARPATRAPRRPPAERAAGAPAAPIAASLEAEVRALRSVERALREGRPGLALALLRELDRAVPGGRLVEEREATAAIARCAAGDLPFGVDLAGEFAGRHPDSVYRERVEQACAAATDPSGSGDSSGRR
jgi:hypothetical protein